MNWDTLPTPEWGPGKAEQNIARDRIATVVDSSSMAYLAKHIDRSEMKDLVLDRFAG